MLTSCERPPADGSRPLSLGRLSLGELHPETGVLLLLGDESGDKRSKYVSIIHRRVKIKTDTLKKKQKTTKKRLTNSFYLISFVFTQCVRCSMFDSRRGTLFAGEWTLAGV